MAWKGIKQFFRKDIEVRCEYCIHSSDFDGACVCQLGKYRTPEGDCRKFAYDPLKRIPQNLPPLREYDPEDFKL